MRRHLFAAAVMVVALAGGARAQGDLYDNPALGSTGALLRNTDKLMADIQRSAVQGLNPYQRQQYENCVAQGGGASDCVTAAQAARDPNQPYDVYSDPALGSTGALLRQADKAIAEGNRFIFAHMSPQERQEYDQCVAQGLGNCMFMAQQHEQDRQFARESQEIDRLSRGCYYDKDQQACDQLQQLQAAIQRRTDAFVARGNAQLFQDHVYGSIGQQQQRLRDRETASQYRMNGWSDEEAAKAARGQGLDDAAAEYQRRSDENYQKAKEWEPPSPYSGR